jgi:WD40 repeat protein
VAKMRNSLRTAMGLTISICLLLSACGPQTPTSVTGELTPEPSPTIGPSMGATATATAFPPPLPTALPEPIPHLPIDLAVIDPDNINDLQTVAYLSMAGVSHPSAGLTFSLGDYTLAVVSETGELNLWDYPSGKLLQSLEVTARTSMSNASLAFSHPYGHYLAVSDSSSEEDPEFWPAVYLWDSWRPDEPRLVFGTNPWEITSVAFSPEDDILAIGTRDQVGGGGSLELVDVESEEVLHDLRFSDEVTSVAFAPDGATLALSSANQVINLDPVTGMELHRWEIGDLARGLVYSPDGSLLAVLSDEVYLIETRTGMISTTWSMSDEIHSITFSPDGRLLVAGSGQLVHVWDVARRDEMDSFMDGAAVLGVAFSPDGRVLGSVNADGTVRLWGVRVTASLPIDAPVISPANATLLQHTARLAVPSIFDLTFSGDLTWLALGTRYGIYLLETPNLQLMNFLPIGERYSSEYDISGDGRWLAWVSDDDVVKVWDSQTQAEHLEITSLTENCCTQLSLSHNGETLVMLDGSMARVWDLTTPEEIYTRESIQSIELSPDGNTIAFESQSEIKVTLWDVAHRIELRDLTGFSTAAPFYFTFLSPDWRTLVWGARATLQFTDVATGDLGAEFSFSRGVFSPDGNLLAAVEDGWYGETYAGQVLLVDVDAGEELAILQNPDFVRTMEFSPDGRLLAVSIDDKITLWDVARQAPLTTLTDAPGQIYGLVFSTDGRILASMSETNSVDFWAVPETTSIVSPIIEPSNAAEVLPMAELEVEGPTDVVFSPDGDLLVVSSESGGLYSWDLVADQPIQFPTSHSDWVYQLAFSPDGNSLASASKDGTFALWNMPTGGLMRLSDGHEGEVSSVAFFPDGLTLASCSQDQTIRLWEHPTLTERTVLSELPSWIWDVAVSPNGNLLASASADKAVRIVDTTDGELIHTLTGHTATVWSVAFSPDGSTLASSSWDGTIKLWNVLTGSELFTLRGHADWVYEIAFSPDGRVLASASKDGTVRLWDAVSGELLRSLEGHADKVWGVAFSPDGRLLASVSADNTVRLWSVQR